MVPHRLMARFRHFTKRYDVAHIGLGSGGFSLLAKITKLTKPHSILLTLNTHIHLVRNAWHKGTFLGPKDSLASSRMLKVSCAASARLSGWPVSRSIPRLMSCQSCEVVHVLLAIPLRPRRSNWRSRPRRSKRVEMELSIEARYDRL